MVVDNHDEIDDIQINKADNLIKGRNLTSYLNMGVQNFLNNSYRKMEDIQLKTKKHKDKGFENLLKSKNKQFKNNNVFKSTNMHNTNTESVISLDSKDGDISPFNIKNFDTNSRYQKKN